MNDPFVILNLTLFLVGLPVGFVLGMLVDFWWESRR